MDGSDGSRLAKFYPMDAMKDRNFVLYGVAIISKALQSLLDEWLPVVKGASNYHTIEDPYWDFIANIRVCEAMQLIDKKLIDDLAVVTQLAGLYVSKPRTKLASKRVTEIVNRLGILQTLEGVVEGGDASELHIAVLQMNLGSTRDRYRMAVRMLDANLLDIAAAAGKTASRRFGAKSASLPAELTDVDRAYRSAIVDYEDALQQAIDFSHRAGNRPSETSRIFWSSLLFTRLCNFGVSIARLSPGSSYSHHSVDGIWDNSSASTLARSAFECFLLFFYLGIDEVPEDEWAARQNLMYLHDATMRLRVFHHMELEDPARSFYNHQRDVLITKLDESAYFQSISEKRRVRLRKGRDLFFDSQDEIIVRIGWDEAQIRRFYEFLSAHVHSLPVAFYKATEDGRGRGVENDPEKAYLAQALEFTASILKAATELYRTVSVPYLEEDVDLEPIN